MPLNESSRKRRERWPLEFDLEAIPRDTRTREQLLRARFPERFPETENHAMSPVNRFASDQGADLLSLMTPAQKAEMLEKLLNTAPQGRQIDLNKPPVEPYQYREFPKMVYHHESGRVLEVANPEQLRAALNRGFDEKPSVARDYSQIRNGAAKAAEHYQPRPEEMSAEQLAELDAVDRGEASDESGAESQPQAQQQEAQQSESETPSRRRR